MSRVVFDNLALFVGVEVVSLDSLDERLIFQKIRVTTNLNNFVPFKQHDHICSLKVLGVMGHEN